MILGVAEYNCNKCNKKITISGTDDPIKPSPYCKDCQLVYDGIIPQQYNKGYKHGRADARIVGDKNMKINRYMSVNNLNHEHDDFIMGYCQGFVDQKKRMSVRK